MRGEDADFEPPFDLDELADYEEIVGAWEDELRRLVPRSIDTPSAQLDQDEDAVRIAWSAQIGHRADRARPRRARPRHHRACDAVCLAGGVALNCSTNGLLPEPLYVPPVSHDAGGALGSAWAVAPPRAPQARALSVPGAGRR